MNSSSFDLLTNEGALMQGCFKSSLAALRNGSSAERGPFYVTFFNYAIGLERLLKLIIMLDHWHRNQSFPDNSELKQSGHNVEKLYGAAKNLFGQYGVEWKHDYEADSVNLKLLRFISDFGNGSRYFNLNTLAEASNAVDPLCVWESLLRSVYESDVPLARRRSNEDEVSKVVGITESHTVYIPSTSLGGDPQSYGEFCQDHGKLRLVLPEMCWRLVKILIPMQVLLIEIRERVQEEDHGAGEDLSVPYLEEFLDFVCEDKNVVLSSEDWP